MYPKRRLLLRLRSGKEKLEAIVSDVLVDMVAMLNAKQAETFDIRDDLLFVVTSVTLTLVSCLLNEAGLN